jgi:hypothetical protein
VLRLSQSRQAPSLVLLSFLQAWIHLRIGRRGVRKWVVGVGAADNALEKDILLIQDEQGGVYTFTSS